MDGGKERKKKGMNFVLFGVGGSGFNGGKIRGGIVFREYGKITWSEVG